MIFFIILIKCSELDYEMVNVEDTTYKFPLPTFMGPDMPEINSKDTFSENEVVACYKWGVDIYKSIVFEELRKINKDVESVKLHLKENRHHRSVEYKK